MLSGLSFLGVFTFFSLQYLLLSSGLSIPRKLPLQEINGKASHRILLSPSIYDTELDDIPVVNPTAPGTGSPTTPPYGGGGGIGNTMPPPVGGGMAPGGGTGTTSPPVGGTGTTNPPAGGTGTTNPPAGGTGTTNPPATGGGSPGGGGGGRGGGRGGGGGSWCVANPTASPTTLQVALDYACGYGGADCSPIQPGGSCYNPNTVKDHASFAFNEYYQKNPTPTSCVFGGAAQLTNNDPSTGSCRFPSSSGASLSPPTSLSPPMMMSPPTTMTPPDNMMTPPYSTVPGTPVYGGAAEPAGLPSSSDSLHCPLALMLTFTFIISWHSVHQIRN